MPTQAKTILDVSLFEHQLEVFNSPAKNICYAKGRRVGGTEGAVRKLIQLQVTHPNRSALWVDTVYKNIRRYMKRYFMPILSRGLHPDEWHWNGQDMTLTFWNGSLVDFGSADNPESLEGFGYQHIVVNEAGIVLMDLDLYEHTLRPMAMEGEGAVWWFVGTPKGANLYATFIARGEDPHYPEWATFRHESTRNPLVNPREVEAARRELPEAVFRQEYLGEVVEDAGFFKNVQAIFDGQPETRGEAGTRYVIGLDLAREEDFTVAWVGRPDQRRGVCCDRYTRVPWPHQVKRIKALSERFNHAHVIADATGLGGQYAVDDLLQAGVSVEPYPFTAASKYEVMSNLAVEMEQARLHLPEHKHTLNELLLYQQTRLPSGNIRLSAPSGAHDDCVVALALMVHGFGSIGLSGLGEIVTGQGIGSRYTERL